MIRLSEYIISLLFIVTGGVLLWSAMPTGAQSLAYTLQGKILLQVEENGEAWYIYPASLERYYLGRPADAFDIMRNLGLGITNADLAKIPTDTENFSYLKHDKNLQQRLSGTILLQVEEHGEAWYVYPDNLKRYYLGRPADAFDIMRNLGLGISNENLLGIPISVDSKLPEYTPGNNTSNTQSPELNDGRDAQRNTLLSNMNTERSAAQVQAYQLSRQLNQAAQAQADDMTSQNYFDFVSPQGKNLENWLQDAGYMFYVSAENIIQTNQGIGSVVASWKSEQGTSYSNVVDGRYSEVGVGVGSYQGFPTYVVIFAYPFEDYFNEQTSALASLDDVRIEMLALVNQERQAVGLPLLVMNGTLNQAAQGHTDDMLNRSYYAHESPEGTLVQDRITALGYNYQFAGENIAKGQFSVQQVMQEWMASPGHRANILSPDYQEVGFGLSYGKNQNGFDILWAQNFGAPL